MISSFSSKLIDYFCPCFSVHAKAEESEDVEVCRRNSVRVVVPERPLAMGSVRVEYQRMQFSQSYSEPYNESFELIQKIVRVWQDKGIHDYLVYSKEVTGKESSSREIVPFQKQGWRIWKQFKVIWRITFGAPVTPILERQRIARELRIGLARLDSQHSPVERINEIGVSKDVFCKFCNPDVISRQLVFEGKHVYVLHDHAPITIGKGKLHFLLLPKVHCSKFSDLTEQEYLEVCQLALKIINCYKNKGFHTAYHFNKSGRQAGQSVLHWHEHLVLTSSSTEEFLGKLVVLKNMVLGKSKPLSRAELAARIALAQDNLEEHREYSVKGRA
jgi:diadenosine tetraphosphate (Ap4A) HIT family hydrolase